MRSIALTVCAVAVILAACGGSGAPANPRQIDVSTLTFDDVQQHTLAALAVEGKVFHVTEISDTSAQLIGQESWIDATRDQARQESTNGLQVYHDRRVTTNWHEGTPSDAAIGSDVHPLEKTWVYASHYLSWIFEQDYKERSLHEGTVDGEPAIVVQVSQKMYERSAIETVKVYLDEQFLPLQMEDSNDLPEKYGGGSRTIALHREWLDRDSLPDGFLSPDSVKARTPFHAMNDASDAGLPVYWLGEQFEDAEIKEANFERSTIQGEGMVSASYRYGDQEQCISVGTQGPQTRTYFEESRNQWRAMFGANLPDPEQVDSVMIGGRTAKVFRQPPRPRPTELAAPYAPDHFPEFYFAELPLDSGQVVVISESCLPPENAQDVFVRLVGALRQYDAP